MTTIVDGVDYGPLAQLLGKWIGQKGLDDAPDAQANSDKTEFIDELVFSPAGPAENAEEQQLVAIQYHHVVRKLDGGHIFHDQVGHWLYEKSTQNIMHSLSIPRGVCVLAGGKYKKEGNKSVFLVNATKGNDDFGIVQSPFMLEKAQTKAFQMNLSVEEDVLQYREIISLEIYGKSFEHSDESILQRVRYYSASHKG